MVVISVYRRNETVIHKSNLCSKATLVVIITIITAVITPLIIVYRCHGLWIKESEYREQPDVNFKYSVLLITDTSAGPLIWSSSSTYNSLMAKYVRTPLIKSTEVDENHDGLKDRLHFSLRLPLLAGEFVYGTSLLLTFDFRLQRVCKVTMEGAGLLQHSSGTPLTAVHHYVDLTLFQRHPLTYSRSNSLYNISVLPTSAYSTKDWSLSNILLKYWERNLTTRFTNTYTTWQNGNDDALTLSVEVQYPEQTILYNPGFWYVIKWAWVQYFCVLAAMLYITNLVKDWIFQNCMVSTWVDFSDKKIM